jgi:hypothetical protein
VDASKTSGNPEKIKRKRPHELIPEIWRTPTQNRRSRQPSV